MGHFLVLSACQNVPIENAEFIGSLGPLGAVTFDLLDGNSRDLDLQAFAKEWDDLSNPDGPLICTRSKNFANLKRDLESLCSWNPSECTVEAQQAVNNFMSRVQSVNKKKQGKK